MPLDKINDEWIKMLRNSVEQLVIHMKQNDDIDKYPLQFYWKFIGGISTRIKSHWHDHYCILNEVAQIHRDLYSIITSKKGTPHIDAYVSLVEKIRESLSEWKTKITSKEINFNDILNLLEKHEQDDTIALKFGLKKAIVDIKKLSDAKREFVTSHQQISQLLIKINPRHNW